MSPLPPGFSTPEPEINSVERLLAYACSAINAAGSNASATQDETAPASARAIQLYPLQVPASTQPWTLILRLSCLLPNSWSSGASPLWAQISPVGASTNLPTGWSFPSSLLLTNWERVAFWCFLALQATFPNPYSPEAPGVRQVIAYPVSVDFTPVRSWLLIGRASLLMTGAWATTQPWRAVTPIGNTAIPAAYL